MTAPMPFSLVESSRDYLAGFAAALAKGWSPNNATDVSAAFLARIEADADAFLAELADQSGIVTLPDGSIRPRLPFILRWMFDGEFCGSISLRWQAGTDALPFYVLGHIGYAVVPWKRRRGYATEALRRMLGEARSVGLGRVEITADLDNAASIKVIEACGGRYLETFVNRTYDETPRVRYAIELAA